MRRLWTRLVTFCGLAIAVFLVGAVVGAAIVYTLHTTNVLATAKAATPRAASSEVPRGSARALAERFRPWLRFDTAEHWRPLNIASLFKERVGGAPAHRLCAQAQSVSKCEPVGDEAEFIRRVHEGRAFGGGLHLDLHGTALKDYHGPRRCAPLFDCGGAPGSAIYYHVTRSNGRYYMDYWWFLRFNDFYRTSDTCRQAAFVASGVCDQHEGDWEGVTVVTPPGRPNALDYVVYAAHTGTFRYAASQLHKHGLRPEVFLARGSHAAYPKPCASAHCMQPAALAQGLVRLPEGRFDGAKSWERNAENCSADVPTSCLLSLPRTDEDPNSWTVWPGQWGAGCQAACHGLPGVNSPQSPGVQPRYKTPSCRCRARHRPVTARRSDAATGSGRWSRSWRATPPCSRRPSPPPTRAAPAP